MTAVLAIGAGFWCSGALGRPWTWEYRPLLGVWVLSGLLLGGYALLLRREPVTLMNADQRSLRRRRAWQFAGGVAALWIASDWPLGPLGAGYLASVAAARYLIFVLAAAPLMILGLPASAMRRILAVPVLAPAVKVLTKPLVALLVLNAVFVVSQLPPVVDTLKVNQLGSFALDMAWLVSALLFWVPVLSPVRELPRLSAPLRVIYLFVQSIVPTVPASFLTFARDPLYKVYELTPRITGLSVVEDQQLAGLGMKLVGGLILWLIMAAIFFRWARSEEDMDGAREGRGNLRDLERDLEAHELRV